MCKQLIYFACLILLPGLAGNFGGRTATNPAAAYGNEQGADFAGSGSGYVEDFETGDFSKFAWEYGGDNSWTITSRRKHSGTYSARAGDIEDDGRTTLQVTLDCVSGNITFYRRVSSESGCDQLRFYIDGEEKGAWSGEKDWAEVSFSVKEGTRIFEWTYSKDFSSSRGDDTAWIDDIAFPVVSDMFWRSSLYPDDWTAGYKDSQGRFLHDFSYAGYHSGEAEIPQPPPGPVVDVTHRPYNADNTGTSDATSAIQRVIDYIGSIGGGIVYLPAGTYRLRPSAESNYALRISHSGVVLRGDGAGKTFLLNDEAYMRSKSVILVRPASGGWHSPLSGTEVDITRDVEHPTHTIPVADTTKFRLGQWVVLRTDCTNEFIDEHRMTGLWNSGLRGITFYRRITGIDPHSSSISVDIPTRYYLKTRDRARVYKVGPHLEEVGIEHLSIGMRENLKAGLADNDYDTPGTAAYEVHNSHFIQFDHVTNGWIQDIHTYRPRSNTHDWHTLSNIILLNQSRNVTIRNCVIARPQYEGGGGNGYGYTLRGSDCLLIDCSADHTRHNYDFKSMWTSGNVIFRCQSHDGRLASDFHMHLSPANLFDSMVVDGDCLEASYRPYGTTLHGHTTTESVFWNTYGTERCRSRLIVSRQWKWGYVIGTSGTVSNVERGTQNNTAPEDFLEGEGKGLGLMPQSLYLDQLSRRLQSGRTKASNPSPADRAKDVLPDVSLSWTAGAHADKHDVYLGTVFDDVINAGRANPLGVLVSQNQSPNSYTPPGPLAFGTTYYWRVDEVNAPPDDTIYKGNIWQFTTGVFSYPVENVIATASSSSEAKGPENTVNGSGLDDSGLLHGNVGYNTMWLSGIAGPQPTWIEFEFDRIYKLHRMWVWNSNESVEQAIGLGFKNVTIEYSSNGTGYTTLGTTHEFAQAPGTPDYAHNTTVDFGGVSAKFVRLTANSNWGGILNQYSLSEVRFFYIPAN